MTTSAALQTNSTEVEYTLRFANHLLKSELEDAKRKFTNPGQALAEFADNSVDAMCSQMVFNITPEGNLYAYDNGIGMPFKRNLLNEMLSIGSSEKLQKRGKHSIGHHGYGMKASVFYFASMEHITELTFMSYTRDSNSGWFATAKIDPSKSEMEPLSFVPISKEEFLDVTGFESGFYIEMNHIDESIYDRKAPRFLENNDACSYIIASSYVNYLKNGGSISIQTVKDWYPTVYSKDNLPEDCDVMYRHLNNSKVSHQQYDYEVVLNGKKENVGIYVTKFSGMVKSDYTSKADQLYFHNNNKFGLSIILDGSGIALFTTDLNNAANAFISAFKPNRFAGHNCDTIRVELTFGPEMSKAFLKTTSNNKRETKLNPDTLTPEEVNVFAQLVRKIDNIKLNNVRTYGEAQCEHPFTMIPVSVGCGYTSMASIDWTVNKEKKPSKIVDFSVDESGKNVVTVFINHQYFSDMNTNSKKTAIDTVIRKWMIMVELENFTEIASHNDKDSIINVIDKMNAKYTKYTALFNQMESAINGND